MNALTTIKNTGIDSFSIFNANNDMIATASEIKAHEEMAGKFEYRISIYGGIAHGKIAYACDFQDLNDKSVQIASIPR